MFSEISLEPSNQGCHFERVLRVHSDLDSETVNSESQLKNRIKQYKKKLKFKIVRDR